MDSPWFEDSNVNEEHHYIFLYKDHVEGKEVILVLWLIVNFEEEDKSTFCSYSYPPPYVMS